MRPTDFAAQLNVSLANGWGIVRTVTDLCMKMPEGKYVLVKDPNKVRLTFRRLFVRRGGHGGSRSLLSHPTLLGDGDILTFCNFNSLSSDCIPSQCRPSLPKKRRRKQALMAKSLRLSACDPPAFLSFEV